MVAPFAGACALEADPEEEPTEEVEQAATRRECFGVESFHRDYYKDPGKTILIGSAECSCDPTLVVTGRTSLYFTDSIIEACP
jgi:hypothetical protein